MIVTLHEDAYHTGDSQLGYVIRKPAGVAGLITPWNTPFMLETWKLAPALASGCTVVLKPAEWTPLSASLLPEIMGEAGIPPGVFNMVHGIGENAGRRPGCPPRGAADLVHWRDRNRAGDHAVRRDRPQGSLDGAWRQVPVHRVR